MDRIFFFSEDIDFQLNNPQLLADWISSVVDHHNQAIESINYIYCSDNYLLNINQEYLDHDYFTDIITFDNRDFHHQPIDADIFISIDRVQDNSEQYNIPFHSELHRVMVHGVLHLLGQGDKTQEEKKQMREKEDAYLSLLQER